MTKADHAWTIRLFDSNVHAGRHLRRSQNAVCKRMRRNQSSYLTSTSGTHNSAALRGLAAPLGQQGVPGPFGHKLALISVFFPPRLARRRTNPGWFPTSQLASSSFRLKDVSVCWTVEPINKGKRHVAVFAPIPSNLHQNATKH